MGSTSSKNNSTPTLSPVTPRATVVTLGREEEELQASVLPHGGRRRFSLPSLSRPDLTTSRVTPATSASSDTEHHLFPASWPHPNNIGREGVSSAPCEDQVVGQLTAISHSAPRAVLSNPMHTTSARALFCQVQSQKLNPPDAQPISLHPSRSALFPDLSPVSQESQFLAPLGTNSIFSTTTSSMGSDEFPSDADVLTPATPFQQLHNPSPESKPKVEEVIQDPVTCILPPKEKVLKFRYKKFVKEKESWKGKSKCLPADPVQTFSSLLSMPALSSPGSHRSI